MYIIGGVFQSDCILDHDFFKEGRFQTFILVLIRLFVLLWEAVEGCGVGEAGEG